MIFILIITALPTAAKGSINCSFTETSEGQQCFGAVGQLLLFHLPNTRHTDIKLTKDEKYLVFKRSKNLTVNDDYVEQHGNTQSDLLINGMFILGKAKKSHSGNYTVEVHDNRGVLQTRTTAHLEINAPVSEPAVTKMCSSPEQREVICSSEGEEVELSLSLNGHLLINSTHPSLTPTNGTDTASPAESITEQNKSGFSRLETLHISLNGQQTGNLTCKVWNKVSRHQTVVRLTDCKDLISSFPVVTLVAVVAAVIVVLSVVLCLCLINRHDKRRPGNVTEYNDETEVVYTQVTVIKNKKKAETNSDNNQT